MLRFSFTLIEVLVAISILGLFFSLIYRFYFRTQKEMYYSQRINQAESEFLKFFSLLERDLDGATIGYYITVKFKKQTRGYYLLLNQNYFKLKDGNPDTSATYELDIDDLPTGTSNADVIMKFRIVSVDNEAAILEDTNQEKYDWVCYVSAYRDQKTGKCYFIYSKKWKIEDIDKPTPDYYHVFKFPVASVEVSYKNFDTENSAFFRICVFTQERDRNRVYWKRRRCVVKRIGTIVKVADIETWE